ncbi:MAG: DUF2970 domain-containing protein [Kangiellaceae bacterium]|nr:DUF2970 domain-containing protein [Kangiellaceae bacterium]
MSNDKNSQPITSSESNSNPTSTRTDSSDPQQHQGTGFWSIVKSVVGAMFGVQSEAQREKDFEQGSAMQFIVGGIVFTLVFIFTILYFVNSALESSGQG